MKKYLLAISFIAALFTTADAQLRFGVGASYLTDVDGQVGIQGKSLIGINENFILSPSANAWLGDGLDWSVDADLQYNLLAIGESFHLRPFAGLNLASTSVNTDLALNLGASFVFDLESGSSIYIEPKYIVVDFNALVISAGYLF